MQCRPGPRSVAAACMGVRMMPSATALARIPRAAYSIASDLGDRVEPALGQGRQRRRAPASWRGRPGWSRCSRRDRRPRGSIAATRGAGDLEEPAQVHAGDRRRSRSSVYSVNGLAMKMPALLTTVSTRPNRSSAASTTRRRRPAGRCRRATVEHHRVVAVRRWCGSWRRRRSRACGRPDTRPSPMPCEAPVMMATRCVVVMMSDPFVGVMLAATQCSRRPMLRRRDRFALC